ncbi:MAG TPA: DUF4058 family protein [Tepidisphaeraceae bacterium]|nr:DUF4058 family protein [Tepidisphaeraceae bacterium]
MPSPFPGMNPYLEQEDIWHDFHERFIPAVAEMLLPQVRPKYIVRLDQQAYVHELPAEERRLIGRPDVYLARGSAGTEAVASSTSAKSPILGSVPLAVDVEKESYVEIRDRQNREIITVIELISPSNKRVGVDRSAYLAKRQDFLGSTAHFVEIDLLRGGPRLPVDGLPPTDYYALISRRPARPQVELYPVRLRDRLPPIPIPLREPDPDAVLDLQGVLDRVYDAAGYEDYMYSRPPEPALSEPDAVWAKQFLPSA